MKNIKIKLLFTLLTFGTLTQPHAQVAAVLAHAQQIQLASMSTLEQDLHCCVKSFAPNFADLTISNISSKKPVIEQGRKKLLAIFTAADDADMTKDYKEAKKILEKLDINQIWQAVQDFKKVLNLIRKETKKLIDDSVSDLIIRKALGF